MNSGFAIENNDAGSIDSADAEHLDAQNLGTGGAGGGNAANSHVSAQTDVTGSADPGVNSSIYADENSLYPSADMVMTNLMTRPSHASYPSHCCLCRFQGYLPVRGFHILRREDNSTHFQYLARQLQDINVDFFHQAATVDKRGFIYDCTLDYDFDASVGNSVDLGSFPYLRRVHIHELGPDQQRDSVHMGRTKLSESPKLVSMHENGHRRVGMLCNCCGYFL